MNSLALGTALAAGLIAAAVFARWRVGVGLLWGLLAISAAAWQTWGPTLGVSWLADRTVDAQSWSAVSTLALVPLLLQGGLQVGGLSRADIAWRHWPRGVLYFAVGAFFSFVMIHRFFPWSPMLAQREQVLLALVLGLLWWLPSAAMHRIGTPPRSDAEGQQRLQAALTTLFTLPVLAFLLASRPQPNVEAHGSVGADLVTTLLVLVTSVAACALALGLRELTLRLATPRSTLPAAREPRRRAGVSMQWAPLLDLGLAYAAYLGGELLHGSGLLAVFLWGLVASRGRRRPRSVPAADGVVEPQDTRRVAAVLAGVWLALGLGFFWPDILEWRWLPLSLGIWGGGLLLRVLLNLSFFGWAARRARVWYWRAPVAIGWGTHPDVLSVGLLLALSIVPAALRWRQESLDVPPEVFTVMCQIVLLGLLFQGAMGPRVFEFARGVPDHPHRRWQEFDARRLALTACLDELELRRADLPVAETPALALRQSLKTELRRLELEIAEASADQPDLRRNAWTWLLGCLRRRLLDELDLAQRTGRVSAESAAAIEQDFLGEWLDDARGEVDSASQGNGDS